MASFRAQPGRSEPVGGPLTEASIGTIEYSDLDWAIECHRKLARALWRTALLEESILRERLELPGDMRRIGISVVIL